MELCENFFGVLLEFFFNSSLRIRRELLSGIGENFSSKGLHHEVLKELFSVFEDNFLRILSRMSFKIRVKTY